MENQKSDHTEGMQQQINKIYPDAPAFIKFLMPFIEREENYKKFLEILKAVGVEKGIDGVAEILFDMIDMASESGETVAKAIVAELEKRYVNKPAPSTIEEFYKSAEDIVSFEGSMIYAKKVYESFSAYLEKYEALVRSAEALPEDKQIMFNYFGVVIFKLWIYFFLTKSSFPTASKEIVKAWVLQYSKGRNALYPEEKFPKELIEYVETIKIPEVEQIKNTAPDVTQKFVPQMTIPVFHQVEDILKVLKKYFDPAQHNELMTALRLGSCKQILVFKGNGIQLADAFKKLYITNLITSCDKTELIEWIKNNFEYKSNSGEVAQFATNYLENIIASNQKFCKNPIIEITKDGDKAVLFSPDKKSRGIF